VKTLPRHATSSEAPEGPGSPPDGVGETKSERRLRTRGYWLRVGNFRSVWNVVSLFAMRLGIASSEPRIAALPKRLGIRRHDAKRTFFSPHQRCEGRTGDDIAGLGAIRLADFAAATYRALGSPTEHYKTQLLEYSPIEDVLVGGHHRILHHRDFTMSARSNPDDAFN